MPKGRPKRSTAPRGLDGMFLSTRSHPNTSGSSDESDIGALESDSELEQDPDYTEDWEGQPQPTTFEESAVFSLQLAEQYGPDAAAHMLSASNLGSGANSPYERSPLGSAANSNVELATMPYAGRGDGGGTHVKYDSVESDSLPP
ncbi:hypothetical protein B0H14DRAFT_3127824 [Mycena olivaceomarginata]|nr:hypothetical protein B0H14DRAFT_3127824 [Mycena olivaceomarginata]